MPFTFDQSEVSYRYSRPKGACQGLSAAWLKMMREGVDDATKKERLLGAATEMRQLVATVYASTGRALERHEAGELKAAKHAFRGVTIKPTGSIGGTTPMPAPTPFTPVESRALEGQLRSLCAFAEPGQIGDRGPAGLMDVIGAIFDFPTSGTTYRYISWKSAVGGDHAGHATAAVLQPDRMWFFDPNTGESEFGASEKQAFVTHLLTSLQGLGFDLSSGLQNIQFGIFYTIDFQV